jgi:type IV secretory pathway VirB2 component (pilin)
MNAGTASLFEPPRAQAFGAMADWLREASSGSLATALGFVAISLVGLSLFQGRLRLKRAAFVVVGIFLLLGASMISAGIVDNLRRAFPPPMPVAVASPIVTPQNEPTKSSNLFDPYAGASVPPPK